MFLVPILAYLEIQTDCLEESKRNNVINGKYVGNTITVRLHYFLIGNHILWRNVSKSDTLLGDSGDHGATPSFWMVWMNL